MSYGHERLSQDGADDILAVEERTAGKGTGPLPSARTEEDGAASPGKRTLTEKMISRSATGAAIDRNADAAISSARGSQGQALPGGLRGDLERATGADLSSVTVHTGEASQRAASSISAAAYTEGQQIHFGAGTYNPTSGEGQKLIAHEVAHVTQQAGATPSVQNKLEVSSPGDAAEHEADAFADSFIAGGIMPPTAAARPGIHRKEEKQSAKAPEEGKSEDGKTGQPEEAGAQKPKGGGSGGDGGGEAAEDGAGEGGAEKSGKAEGKKEAKAPAGDAEGKAKPAAPQAKPVKEPGGKGENGEEVAVAGKPKAAPARIPVVVDPPQAVPLPSVQSIEPIELAPPAAASAPVQRKGGGGASDAETQTAAASGVSGSAADYPHKAAIETSFGRPVNAKAHTDDAAQSAASSIGAEAFATGDHVAFGSPSPSLHTAAHEAVHTMQQAGGVQLSGGVGAAGDRYEQQADTIADKVVAGEKVGHLLPKVEGGATAGLQLKPTGSPDPLYAEVKAQLDRLVGDLQAAQAEAIGKAGDLKQLAVAEGKAQAEAIQDKVVAGKGRVVAAFNGVDKAVDTASKTALAKISATAKTGASTLATTKTAKRKELDAAFTGTNASLQAVGAKARQPFLDAIKAVGATLVKKGETVKTKAKAEGKKHEGSFNSTGKKHPEALRLDVAKAASTGVATKFGEEVVDKAIKPAITDITFRAPKLVDLLVKGQEKALTEELKVKQAEAGTAFETAGQTATAKITDGETTARTTVAKAKAEATKTVAGERQRAETAADDAGTTLAKNINAAGVELGDHLARVGHEDAQVYVGLVENLRAAARRGVKPAALRPQIAAAAAQLAERRVRSITSLENMFTDGKTRLAGVATRELATYERAISTQVDEAKKAATRVSTEIDAGASAYTKSLMEMPKAFDAAVSKASSSAKAAQLAFVTKTEQSLKLKQTELKDQLETIGGKLDRELDKWIATIKKAIEEKAKEDLPAREEVVRGRVSAINKAIDGLGTNESALFKALRDCSYGEIEALKVLYDKRFGSGRLIKDLNGDLSGDDKRAAHAYLNHERAKALKYELKASKGSFKNGFFNDDEERMEDILRAASPEEIESLNRDGVIDDIKGCLGGADLDVVDALTATGPNGKLLSAEERKAKADAIRLFDAMDGVGTDEAKVKSILEGAKTKEERDALRKEFNKYAAKQGNFAPEGGSDRLDTALKDDFSSDEKNLMLALAKSERDETDVRVLKALVAGDGAGTDEAGIYAALEDKDYEKEVKRLEAALVAATAKAKAAPNDLALKQEETFCREQLQAYIKQHRLDLDERFKKYSEYDSAKEFLDDELDAAVTTWSEVKTKTLSGLSAKQRSALGKADGMARLNSDTIIELGAAPPELALRTAVVGAGTDEAAIKAALAGPLSKAAVSEICSTYKRVWGEPLRTVDEFAYVSDGGTLSQMVCVVIDGRQVVLPAGTPVLLKQNIASPPTRKVQLPPDYGSAVVDIPSGAWKPGYSVPTQGGRLDAELSGRDWFEVRVLLCGKPETAAELNYITTLKYDFETSGVFGTAFMWSADALGFTNKYSDLQYSKQEYDKEWAKIVKAGAQSKTLAQLMAMPEFEDFERVASFLQADAEAYGQVKASVVNAVVTALEVIGAVVATILTKGAAAPLLYAVLSSLAISATGIVIKKLTLGDAYGASEFSADAIKALISAAVAGLGELPAVTKLMTNAGTKLAEISATLAKKGFKLVGDVLVLTPEAIKALLSNIVEQTLTTVTDEKTYDKKLGDVLWGESGLLVSIVKAAPRVFFTAMLEKGLTDGLKSGKRESMVGDILAAVATKEAGAVAGHLMNIDNYKDAEVFWTELFKSMGKTFFSSSLGAATGHYYRGNKAAADMLRKKAEAEKEGTPFVPDFTELAHLTPRDKAVFAKVMMDNGQGGLLPSDYRDAYQQTQVLIQKAETERVRAKSEVQDLDQNAKTEISTAQGVASQTLTLPEDTRGAAVTLEAHRQKAVLEENIAIVKVEETHRKQVVEEVSALVKPLTSLTPATGGTSTTGGTPQQSRVYGKYSSYKEAAAVRATLNPADYKKIKIRERPDGTFDLLVRD